MSEPEKQTQESLLARDLPGAELTLFTEVSLLEEPAFIRRYAGALATKNAIRMHMSTGNSRMSLRILNVNDSVAAWERRIAGAEERYAELGSVTGEQLDIKAEARKTFGASPPEAPDQKDIERLAGEIEAIRQKVTTYDELGKGKKFLETIKLLTGRESMAYSMAEWHKALIPDVITFQGDIGLREVVVLQASEDDYRLPPDTRYTMEAA